MGLPKLQDVEYMSPKEHCLLSKMYSNRKDNYRPIIYDIIDFEQSNFNNYLFEIILSCVSYNPKKRPSTTDLLNSISHLDNLFERKSNYNPTSANISKYNSYAEPTPNDYYKKNDNKDHYLESIRNRTRIKRKYEGSYESKSYFKFKIL
jgi:hypothetical protein